MPADSMRTRFQAVASTPERPLRPANTPRTAADEAGGGANILCDPLPLPPFLAGPRIARTPLAIIHTRCAEAGMPVRRVAADLVCGAVLLVNLVAALVVVQP